MNQQTLHLVEPMRTPWPVLAGLGSRYSRGELGPVMLVGGSAAERLAQSYGLTSLDRVSPAVGFVPAARQGLRRFIANRGGFTSLHAWSPGALLLGVLSGLPCSATISQSAPLSRAAVLVMRRAMARAKSVEFVSAAVRDAWGRMLDIQNRSYPIRGFDGPGITVDQSIRARVRSEWCVDDETMVLWGAHDGPGSAPCDARRLAYHVGVMTIAGWKLAAVIHPGSRDMERAVRYTQRHVSQRSWKIIVEDRPMPEFLPGCDIALCLGDLGSVQVDAGARRARSEQGELCLPWARAAGLRVLAPAAAWGPMDINRILLEMLGNRRCA